MRRHVVLVAGLALVAVLVFYFTRRQEGGKESGREASSQEKAALATSGSRIRVSQDPQDPGSPATHSSVGPYSAVLARMLAAPTNWPHWLGELRPAAADAPKLAKLYQGTTNLEERLAVTYALALVGADEALELFKRTLTNDYYGRKLAPGEISVLANTVTALGFVARRSDSAYEFLKQGTDPLFWKRTVSWPTYADTFGYLTSQSIGALGLSGRPDVREFLAQRGIHDLRNPFVDRADPTGRDFRAVIARAAYQDYLLRQMGYEEFVNGYFLGCFLDALGRDAHDHYYTEWRKSEEGEYWRRLLKLDDKPLEDLRRITR